MDEQKKRVTALAYLIKLIKSGDVSEDNSAYFDEILGFLQGNFLSPFIDRDKENVRIILDIFEKY